MSDKVDNAYMVATGNYLTEQLTANQFDEVTDEYLEHIATDIYDYISGETLRTLIDDLAVAILFKMK